MRVVFVLLVFASLISRSLAADPNEKFYELATFGKYEDGRLTIILWENDATWINDRQRLTKDDLVSLKVGDTVESLFRYSDDFLKFKLDSLTPTKATFTKWLYKANRLAVVDKWKYVPGKLESMGKVELDLTKPNGLLVDYGPNHVELGTGITPKSKN